MSGLRCTLMLLAAGALSSGAAGQPGPWPTFVNESATRMVSAPTLGLSDDSEKNYAWGDVNHDGWTDLVVVRKVLNPAGPRPNVFFLNQAGVLTDRTQRYVKATMSLPEGVIDQGFLTPTTDSDVAFVDVNSDGWLDIVTAVTMSDGQPKHIGHPRVYVNLALDERGDWRGFVFDNARIPQLLSNPTCAGCTPQIGNPHFRAVAGGDVTNDGFPELFFADHGFYSAPNLDFNNKLLLNDGTGYFSDETTSALTGSIGLTPGGLMPMWLSGFATSAAVADMNRDGAGDILYAQGVGNFWVGLLYNDPNSAGSFPGPGQVVHPPAASKAAYASAGDLNNDGWLDIIITDDFVDRYRLSTGTLDAQNQIVWGPAVLFPAATDNFGGENYGVDLNNDGFNDVVIADVDYVPTICGGAGADILRSNANPPNVTFSVNSGGIPSNMLNGVHDFGILDINRDGWLDLVIGRCTGTQVWISQPPFVLADLDHGGSVDTLDLGIMLSAWSIPPTAPACGGSLPCAADLNHDGIVNSIDLGMLLAAWSL